MNITAAPGLGYEYKFLGDGVAKNEFSRTSAFSFTVEPGKTRQVTVAVKNAFGRETTETVTITRPGAKPMMNIPMRGGK